MLAVTKVPDFLLALFIFQEIVISAIFVYGAIRSWKLMRATSSELWREVNFGRVLLGIGVVLRSAAIFAPVPLLVRIIIWQIGELLYLGAWHYMFNHDFTELETFLEYKAKISPKAR